MRILMLVHSLRRGGAERVLLELALGLQQRGHDVKVVAWLDVDEYNDACYKSIARHYLLPRAEYRWVRSIPKSATRLRALAARFRPDVIEVHTPNVAWVLAWADLGIPAVHVLHGYGDITRFGSLDAMIIRFISRLVAWRLKATFVTVSDSMNLVASRYFGIGRNNIACINNGIDIKKMSYRSKVPEEGINIIMVGTLSRNKGQALGILAFKEVLEKLPSAKLLIVGDGADRRNLRELIDVNKLTNHAHLLGRREDVLELLAASHLLWQLSKSEAMPMAVLEAMATGIPVIGFDVRGVHHAVVNERTGYLVPYGDVDSIAQMTVQLMQDPSTYETMAGNSMSRAEKYFSIENMINGHERVLMRSARKP